jgi:hypothetical protein
MGTPLTDERADRLAFALQSLAADLAALRELLDTATQVRDVYPLWTETRSLEVELSNIRNEAGWTVNRLMEMH